MKAYIVSLFYIDQHANFLTQKFVLSSQDYVLCLQIFAVIIINGCNDIELKHAKLLSSCYALHIKVNNNFSRNDLIEIMDYIKDQAPVFTADGYFQLNRKLISSFCQIVITYLIVIFQFSSQNCSTIKN